MPRRSSLPLGSLPSFWKDTHAENQRREERRRSDGDTNVGVSKVSSSRAEPSQGDLILDKLTNTEMDAPDPTSQSQVVKRPKSLNEQMAHLKGKVEHARDAAKQRNNNQLEKETESFEDRDRLFRAQKLEWYERRASLQNHNGSEPFANDTEEDRKMNLKVLTEDLDEQQFNRRGSDPRNFASGSGTSSHELDQQEFNRRGSDPRNFASGSGTSSHEASNTTTPRTPQKMPRRTSSRQQDQFVEKAVQKQMSGANNASDKDFWSAQCAPVKVLTPSNGAEPMVLLGLHD